MKTKNLKKLEDALLTMFYRCLHMWDECSLKDLCIDLRVKDMEKE